jgi:hypothetical protein
MLEKDPFKILSSCKLLCDDSMAVHRVGWVKKGVAKDWCECFLFLASICLSYSSLHDIVLRKESLSVGSDCTSTWVNGLFGFPKISLILLKMRRDCSTLIIAFSAFSSVVLIFEASNLAFSFQNCKHIESLFFLHDLHRLRVCLFFFQMKDESIFECS